MIFLKLFQTWLFFISHLVVFLFCIFIYCVEKFDNMIDEKLINRKVENEADEKNGYDFMKENNKEIDNEIDGEFDKYSLPINKFFDQDGSELKAVVLPYETIDV